MMYKTKMVKVYLPGFRLCIFSLTVNLLVLGMQPLTALANRADESAANPTVSPTALEPEILSEINRVRTDPQGYARWLQEQQQYYDGIWLKLPGEKPVRTNKGRKALEEAIAILKNQQPLSPLSISEATAATATSQLEDFATANNIQHISYGRVTPEGIVMGLVVDDLFPDRRRRNSLLSPNVENTGVVCKPDPRYARVCAIAYADSTAELAEAEESNAPQEVATATSNVEVTPTEPDEPATETTAPSLPEDSSTNADLPQPPELPIPPVLPTPSEERAEKEVEPEEIEVEEEPEVIVEAKEPEEESKVIIEVPEAEEEDEVARGESEAEELEIEEPPQESEPEEAEAEVAVDSDSSRLLEKVERGSLEEGDRVISDDNSFYDSYPIEGEAGDSFSIYLESDDFDAFVALIDAEGNIVEQNDDISQEDSNSRIRVTLPEDGIYNVIVNTYDEGGTGNYVLTVSR